MWSHVLTIYVTNFLTLFNFTENFFWRSIISYLNHLYYSIIFIHLYVLIQYKYNNFFFLILNFLTFKLYFLDLINFNLLKSIFCLNNTYKFFFELLIGLVSIHPLIFYLGLSLFIVWYLQIYNNCRYKILNPQNILISLLFALLLGGIWGWLNFSWGYIWVYDFIEYFLFWLVIIIVYSLHTKIYKIKIKNTIWLFNILITYYISLRYGFLPTRHSFFSKISLNTIKQIIYWLLLINKIAWYIIPIFFLLFSKVKIWSTLILYGSIFFVIWTIAGEHSMTKIHIRVLHLIFYFIFLVFSLHTPNYVFYSINYSYFNKNFIFIKNFLLNNYKFLLDIKTAKNSIKVFKSNNFFFINDIYLQVYNTIQLYSQTTNDILLFFIVLIFIILLFIKKW